jgi:N-formylmaleamate deformylase
MLKKINSHPACAVLSSLVFIGSVMFQILSYSVAAAPASFIEQQFTSQVKGSGLPIILIPGLMSDARVWDELTTALVKTHQVHRINIAGFARTPANDNPSLATVKQQLLVYIETQGLKKPAVIGHSLGGFMGFWLASSAPDKIGPIISVDGLPFIGPIFTRTNDSTVASLAAQAAQIKAMYANMSQAQLIAQSRYGLSIQASSEEAQAKVMEMIETSDIKTVGNAIHSLMSLDLRQDIANITSPVLLLGASGGFSSAEQHAAAHELYAEQLEMAPKAQLLMNTDSRHFIMFDDPKWLEQQVLGFLGIKL